MLALLDSSRSLSVSLAAEPEYWTLRVGLEPLASGAASELVAGQSTGPALPMARLPASTALAVLSRSSLKARVDAAKEVSEQLKALLADRAGADEYEALEAGLLSFARGRGDSSILGMMVGAGAGVFATGALRDPEAFHASLSALPKVVRSKAIRDPLSDLFGAVSLRESKQTLGSDDLYGYRLAFGAGGHFSGLSGRGVELLWRASDTAYYVGLSTPPAKSVLEQLVRPKQRLAELGKLEARLRAKNEVSFAAVVRPSLLGLLPPSAKPGADTTIVLSAGRSKKRGYVNVEVPVQVIQSYAEAVVGQ
jgi:hypothetical protein